jgi:hypothetical protein
MKFLIVFAVCVASISCAPGLFGNLGNLGGLANNFGGLANNFGGLANNFGSLANNFGALGQNFNLNDIIGDNLNLFNRLNELKAQTGLNDAQSQGLAQAFASHKKEVVEAFINRLKVKAETLKGLRAFLENLHQQHQQSQQNNQVVDNNVADETVADDSVNVAKRDVAVVDRVKQNKINKLKTLLGLTDAQFGELTNIIKTGDRVKLAQYISAQKLSGKRLSLYRKLTKKLLKQESNESNSSSSEEVSSTTAAPATTTTIPAETTTPLVINDVIN